MMGKNGGRPKKETTGFENKKTTGFKEKETTGFENKKPNVNDNVNDNVNENENVNENVNASILYDDNVEKINNLFIETLGSTNINNIKECVNYLDYMPYEVIEYALKKTARKGAKWDYTMAILDSYIEKHIKTLEQAIADDFNFKNKNKTENKEETQEEKTKRKIKELEELMNANK